jgi:hypothetical protein
MRYGRKSKKTIGSKGHKMIKKELYKQRINALSSCVPLSIDEISNVEKNLGVYLPRDFIEISQICSYEVIGYFDFYNFTLMGVHSVIGATIAARKNVNLPNNYLLLYEDDASVIVMKTPSNPNEEGEVIWCAIEDVYNLIDQLSLRYDHTVFKTFTSFFEFLLDKEEKERAEEGTL